MESAHDEAEVEALKAAARQRIAAEHKDLWREATGHALAA
jgi:hypothetical protein